MLLDHYTSKPNYLGKFGDVTFMAASQISVLYLVIYPSM
jgi:hypothetical protein